MSSADSNPMLIDLFRQEVQGQVQILNDGLVALEQNPDPRQIEPLMRAAHSVKGAARLLGIDPAVKLAHVMEDCLVAVQQRSLSMSASGIDLLLAGTDWLSQFGESAGQNFNAWYEPHRAAVEQLASQLESLLRGEATSAVPPRADSNADAVALIQGLEPSATSAEKLEPEVMPAQPQSSAKWEISQAEVIDPGALAMFRDDMRNCSDFVSSTLKSWQAPLSNAANSQVQDAFANMRGVALVLRIEPLASLIKLCEGAWQAAKPTERAANADDVKCFTRSLELFNQLSNAVGEDYAAQTQTMEAALTAAFDELNVRAKRSQLSAATAASTNTNVSVPPQMQSAKPIVPSDSKSELVTAGSDATRATAKPAAQTVTQTTTHGSPAPETEDAQERVVRVTAKNLTRLMGLAGESLVEARWLQPFAQSLANLKREQDRVADVIDELVEAIPADSNATSHNIIKEMRQRLLQSRTALGGRIEEFESHARRSDDLNSRLYNEVIACRMRPMSDGVQGYPRMVRDISRQLGKNVRYEITGETTPVDRDVLEKLDAPLNHILRNALDHGIETPEERIAAGKPEVATLKLEARHSAGMFAITISDDGRGIDLDKLRAKIVERKLTTADMAARMTDAELYEFLFLRAFRREVALRNYQDAGSAWMWFIRWRPLSAVPCECNRSLAKALAFI